MDPELHELIQNARKELRKASGLPLTPEEQSEEVRNAAVAKFKKFIVSQLGFQVLLPLHAEVIWTERGPIAVLEAEGHAFHLRQERDVDSYLLFNIEGDQEREIARAEASDPNFASRVLVAIGDAVP